jgi:hypothetical protein
MPRGQESLRDERVHGKSGQRSPAFWLPRIIDGLEMAQGFAIRCVHHIAAGLLDGRRHGPSWLVVSRESSAAIRLAC